MYKSGEPLTLAAGVPCAQEPDGRQLARLLRARRERPRRRAAETRDEFPPPHAAPKA